MIYLHLYHGRDTADEDMDDWGYSGPVIGPLTHVQATYRATVRLMNATEDYFLRYEGDLVVFDGKFYGDWSVTDTPDSDVPRLSLSDVIGLHAAPPSVPTVASILIPGAS